MMIWIVESCHPTNGCMLTTRERKTAPRTAPTNEPRPPARLAPPSTAAAMLCSVKLVPVLGFPSPTPCWTAQKKAPTAAISDVVTSAAHKTSSERTPRRLADTSSNPTARMVSPADVRYSHRSHRTASTTVPMNAYGRKLTLASRALVTPESIEPPGTGRCSSASPCSTLRVARVAMIDGSLITRTSVELTSPTTAPMPTRASAPGSSVYHACPSAIVNEATTTHMLMSAPTSARGSQPRSAGTRPMRSAAAVAATMHLTRATRRRAADRADDRLGDAALAQLAAGDLVHDPSAREDDDPVAQPGQLERVARLDDHRHSLDRLRAQRLVDVEPGADVDALRRLVRQDDVQVAAQERPRQRHLLLVATGQEPYRLLDGGRAHLQPAHELGDGVVLAAAADEAGAAEATQHLDRRVRADAEHGEERLAHAVAAEQEDARAQRRV